MNTSRRMSKRKRQALLFFTYGFMTLATIVISAICLLLILGYRLDITDRKIEQGGLIQFRSTPSGATITLDDGVLNTKTPHKLDVSAGTHQVSMKRQGYKEWSKSFSIDAGELLWLNYARLIPTTVKTTNALGMQGTLSDALPTPDRRFVAVIGDQTQPAVQIIDLRNDEAIATRGITIPQTQLTSVADQASTFKIAEWDFGSRFLLVTHQVGDIVEYIRLDRSADDGAARNITKEFNLNFRSMHFSGTSGNVLYGLTDKDIRKVDTDAGSVSQPLITGVESYRLYRENDIAFVALRSDKRVAGVYIDGKETIVRSVPSDQPMLVDVAKYYSHYYVALTTPKGIDIIKDPVETKDTSKVFATLPVTAHGLLWLDISSSGRFVVGGDGNTYSLYDLETESSFKADFANNATGDRTISWLDDFYLISTATGEAKIVEFDGMNGHAITALQAGLPAFLSQDGTYLYSFISKDNKSYLQASRLILE